MNHLSSRIATVMDLCYKDQEEIVHNNFKEVSIINNKWVISEYLIDYYPAYFRTNKEPYFTNNKINVLLSILKYENSKLLSSKAIYADKKDPNAILVLKHYYDVDNLAVKVVFIKINIENIQIVPRFEIYKDLFFLKCLPAKIDEIPLAAIASINHEGKLVFTLTKEHFRHICKEAFKSRYKITLSGIEDHFLLRTYTVLIINKPNNSN